MVENKPTPKPAATSGTDAGQAEMQERADKVQEQGYDGTVPDDTPNEAYALPDAGAGTPEADRVHPDKKNKKK